MKGIAKILTLALLFGAMVVSVNPSTAKAGSLFLFAESAQKTNADDSCTKNGTTYTDNFVANTVMVCNDGAGTGRFVLPAAIPPDAPSNPSFSTRIFYGTADTGASKVCAWSIGINAQPNSATYNAGDATYANITGTSQTHAANKFYYTPFTAVNVYNTGTGADCSGTACNDLFAYYEVNLNTTTTSATSCALRGVHSTY